MPTRLPYLELTTDAVLAMETELCGYLRGLFPFKGHSIYFPPASRSREPEYLAEERRLLLPMFWQDDFLGMLMLTGLDWSEIEPIFPYLPRVMGIVLETLALSRGIGKDMGIGLASEENFYSHLEGEAAKLGTRMEEPGNSLRAGQFFRLCLGMVIISWFDAARTCGSFDFREHVFAEMAKILKSASPANVKAAMLGKYEGRYEFGLLFQANGRAPCLKLAKNIKDVLEDHVYVDELTGKPIKPALSAGFALYPHDMQGREMPLPMLEQSFLLRDRARLAARFASCAPAGASRVMSYNEILARGGIILEDAGHGKYLVNLGSSAGAREGQMFEVMGGGQRKGQIVILETGADEGMAEMVFVEKAGHMPEPGDQLVFIDKKSASGIDFDHAARDDNERITLWDNGKNLKSHAEFLAAFNALGPKYSRFTMGISSIVPKDGNADPIVLSDAFYAALDSLLEEMAKTSPSQAPLLAARYGASGLIFFHADTEGEGVKDFYGKLVNIAEKMDISLANGIFAYPYLSFARQDSETCALKALEYARLLPEPKTGFFNSVALNISADKLYSLGDTFAAMEEYKLALLADPANAAARNSLGVCLADIGKREEAVKMFAQALKDAQDNPLKAKIYYNLGMVFLKRAEAESARRYFTLCARLDREHIFAWLRLGQINEKHFGKTAARKFFGLASRLASGNPDLKNVADRHLARLEGQGGEKEKARNLLHDALLRDPEDAATMLLLAKSYMEGGEDLAMAEMFARKSAALDGNPEAWKILADILVEQGRQDDAQKARARAEK